jgi:hypothetical protein
MISLRLSSGQDSPASSLVPIEQKEIVDEPPIEHYTAPLTCELVISELMRLVSVHRSSYSLC